jgi:hypothetical protein
MTWLYKKVKSNELANNTAGNVEESISPKHHDFFEFDDNTTGVDIDGYLFFPKSVDGDESFSHREFLRTKIMSGGEFVTRGQYIPKEFSFDTVIDIKPEQLDDYLNIFGVMENKVCRITSPYMGGMFKGEVNIAVTNPESSPHVIECKVKIKEIPSAMARLKGDPIIKYPSINTVSDINVKERKVKQESKQEEKSQRYDDYNSSRSKEF